MKQIVLLTALVLVISLINSSCSKKDGTDSTANYDGVWSGNTSQGKTFNITVSNGSITALYIGYSLSGTCSGVPTAQTMTFNIPRPITGNSFSITGSTNISGTFSSAVHATGSFSIDFSGSGGCTSSASGTWTASK
jgi:hypothetical protein